MATSIEHEGFYGKSFTFELNKVLYMCKADTCFYTNISTVVSFICLE